MSAARYEIRGWHVLAGILAFFGIIIAVNVTFAIYAVRSFPGEDVRRSYLQGLHYNDTLAERRAQAALGWHAAAALRDDAAGTLLEVRLTSQDDAINGATLNGDLEWPTSSQFDRSLTFHSVGGGRYVARLGDLTPGRWRLRARAESAAGALDFESELTWPSR
ncbi:MAG: FixH family protein [Hyphomonadaceae bacterium]